MRKNEKFADSIDHRHELFTYSGLKTHNEMTTTFIVCQQRHNDKEKCVLTLPSIVLFFIE